MVIFASLCRYEANVCTTPCDYWAFIQDPDNAAIVGLLSGRECLPLFTEWIG